MGAWSGDFGERGLDVVGGGEGPRDGLGAALHGGPARDAAVVAARLRRGGERLAEPEPIRGALGSGDRERSAGLAR